LQWAGPPHRRSPPKQGETFPGTALGVGEARRDALPLGSMRPPEEGVTAPERAEPWLPTASTKLLAVIERKFLKAVRKKSTLSLIKDVLFCFVCTRDFSSKTMDVRRK